MTILIANYGMGNVGSIANMVRRAGGVPCISSDPQAIAAAGKLVLPGVGSFDNGMKALRETGILEAVREAAASGAPLLGICLGMQLMMDCSEEGKLPGLGLVAGEVRRFASGDALPRVPHMGWNRITVHRPCPLLDENAEEQRYYFVHSYYVSCANSDDVVAVTSHGHEFVSVLSRGNLYGVQFHPEKSHRFGMELFRRFLAV